MPGAAYDHFGFRKRLPACIAQAFQSIFAQTNDCEPRVRHVVLTGRNAKEELIEIADLVTEMGQIKHPFRDGIKAQKGVEF